MSLFPAYQGPRKSLGEWVRATCPQWVTRSMLLHQCYRIHWLTTQGVIKELITHSSIQVVMKSASKQGCMKMVVRTIHTATLYNHFHVLGHKHGQGTCVSCLVQMSKTHMCKLNKNIARLRGRFILHNTPVVCVNERRESMILIMWIITKSWRSTPWRSVAHEIVINHFQGSRGEIPPFSWGKKPQDPWPCSGMIIVSQ